MAEDRVRVQRLLMQHLESLLEAGVTHVPRQLAEQVAALFPTTRNAPPSGAVTGIATNAPLAAHPSALPATPTTVPVRSAPSHPPPTAGPTHVSGPLRAQPAASAGGGRRATAVTVNSASLLDSAADWTPPVPPAERLVALAAVAQEVAGCTLCTELAKCRTQTVFGVGNPQPRLCFLGEAPGADEDAQGEPFVGKAGQLLNKIIEACTLRREDVYILNILKCRPPGNRTPLPHEAANCAPFLERQLAILRPEFICCLGAVAAQNLLQTQIPIGKLRGKFHNYRGIKVLCTYHPAYLLRYPVAKRDTWEDMKLLMSAMGIPISAKATS